MADPFPCAEGATEVHTRRCVDGVWVEGWTAASEFGGVALATLTAAGPCAKVEAIKLAGELKWKPDELVKVLKALG